MKIRLSDFLVEHLLKKGISDTFMITGGGAMHIDDALGHHDKMNKIFNHNEQACTLAAEGYTRVHNKLCLVSVTTGPGGTNAISGVYGAWTDSIPMLVVSGQVKRETSLPHANVKLRQLGDQEVDIVSLVKPVTKFAVYVDDPNLIQYYLDKAIYLATTGRPGPVWIDIPVDVQGAIIDTTKLKKFEPKKDVKPEYPLYNGLHFKDIINRIKKAKRPVICAGDGIHVSNSEKLLIKFAEKYDIPITTPWGSHDLIWDDHKLYGGRPGMMGNRAGNFNVQNADLLLILGYRCGIRQISYNYQCFAKNAYKVMVDIDKNEMYKRTLKIDMPIHADVHEFLEYFIKNDKNSYSHSDWVKHAHSLNKKYHAALPEYYKHNKPLNPYVFFDKFFHYLNKDDVVVTGNGSAAFMSQQVAYIKKGLRYFTNSGSAAMGYGFPAAIGAAVAQKGGRVICIDGDGSFQMNLQELQTAVYSNFNIKILYINNNGYSSIMQTQTNLFKPPLFGVGFGSKGLSFPNMSKVVTAYGIPYYKIDSINNIVSIKDYINKKGLAFIEVVVDPKQFFAPKLASKKLPNGKMISPELDDMSPFLSRNEYKKNKL